MAKHGRARNGYPTNRKNFLILPIVFFLLAYLLLAVIFVPLLKPFGSVFNMIFLEQRVDHSKPYEDIFDSSHLPNAGLTQINDTDIEMPVFGTAFGKLTVDNTSVDTTLFFGDSNTELKNGAGMYNGSRIPGSSQTCLIGGHNNTYFNGLKDAKLGDQIHIDTNYGQYVYRITDMKVMAATEFDINAQTADVILYTCYPFDMLGLTPQRYFVYGEYVSGPKIVEKVQE